MHTEPFTPADAPCIRHEPLRCALLMKLFVVPAVIILHGTASALQIDTTAPGTMPHPITVSETRRYPSFVNTRYCRSFPVSQAFTVGYWSDKLALTPYRDFLSIGKEGNWQRLAAQLLVKSFDLKGASAESASHIITDAVKGGISIYGSSNLTLLNAVVKKMTIGVQTSLAMSTQIPEAPFLLLFSDDKGLTRGANLPLTHMGMQARLMSDVTFSVRHNLPTVLFGKNINRFITDIMHMQNAVWHSGLTIAAGHAYTDLQTVDGGVHLSDDASSLYVDAVTVLTTSGIGIDNLRVFALTFQDGFPVSGIGAGVTSGLLLYNDNVSLSLELSRIGPMVWNGMREALFTVRTRNISAADLFEKDFNLFDPEEGGTYPSGDKSSTIHTVAALWCSMPAQLTLETNYRFYGTPKSNLARMLSGYLTGSFIYEQSLAAWPGHSFVPGFTLSAENGFFNCKLPLRLGCGLGGARGVTSFLTIGASLGKFTIQVGYDAIGTYYLYPERGCSVFVGVSTGSSN